MTTTKHSVIPDASVLVEEWERAAAGRSEPEVPEPIPPGVGLLIVVSTIVLTAYGTYFGVRSLGRWLCGC